MGVRAWQARGRDASRVGTEAGAFLGEGTGIRLSRGDYNEQGGDTISGAGDAGLASPQRGRFAGGGGYFFGGGHYFGALFWRRERRMVAWMKI